MSILQDLLAGKREEIHRLAGEFGVHDVRVFGSALRGNDTPESDLDLLIEAPPGLSLLGIARLELALEDLLGVKVDVVDTESLSPFFREDVLKEARPL